MSTPYQRGAAFEHRVKAELERAGFRVWRTPGSKSECDLIALKDYGSGPWLASEVWLVQCKLRGQIGRKEVADLISVATRVGAKPVLARMLPGTTSGLIHYRDLLVNVEMEV